MIPTYRKTVRDEKQALAHLLIFLTLRKDESCTGLPATIQTLFEGYLALQGVDMEAEVARFCEYRKTDNVESFEFIKYLVEVLNTRIPVTILKMATEVVDTANNYTQVEWIVLWDHLSPFLEIADAKAQQIIVETKKEIDSKRLAETE